MSSTIKKTDWISNFTLVGTPVIGEYTYKINEKSEKSDWVYNSLNLGIDCGEKHGTVYAEMMGGYGEDRDNVLYVHGKKEDGSDDFENKIEVDWKDRFNDSILETIGDLSFITIGLEKTDKGKTFCKKFLSAYDAIAYVQEHLTSDMVVNVRGSLKYSEYNGTVQVKKTINSIVLSKVDDSSKYFAHFTQSILIDKDSTSLKSDNIDKDKGVMYVNARVLDYVKEKDGVEIKGQYPFNKPFEFAMDFSNEKVCKLIMDKLFKVKKGITQITFEGDLVEGGAVVTATLDDIPDDIKELIEMGIFSEEEALAKCSDRGSREHRMILRKPYIKLVGDDKIPVVQKFEGKYTEEDLYIDLGVEEDEEVPFDENTASSSSEDLAWLNNLS